MARIAHFIDTRDSGGAERVVVDLCGRLPELGHEPRVLHLGNPWIERQCRLRHIPCARLGHEGWYRSKWSVGLFGAALAVTLRRLRIDLLHSHLIGPISAGAVAARGAGIPHVGTLHDIYNVVEQPRRLLLLRLAALLGTRLVAVSDDMQRFYGARGMAVERVYNGIDVTGFAVAVRRPDRPVTLVSVGRLVTLKGHDLLLRALALTGADGPRLRLLGDGKERAALERLADELGLRPRVEFLGFRDDVAQVLVEADGFVLASRSEGLSCSVMEAMAAGLPCVVTDVGGNRELVTEGENGFLVPPDDVAALGAGISALARDGGRAAGMGAASRRRAAELFSIGTTLRAYDAIYRRLLGARPPRGGTPVVSAERSPRGRPDERREVSSPCMPVPEP